MKKILKLIVNILRVFAYIVVIAFVIVVCMQKFSNNKFSFLDYRLFVVVTNSMEPRYNVGDVVISKDMEANLINEGDTITYLGEQYNFKDKIITHEVVKIEKDEKGQLLFRTKGINNLIEDPIVREEQVLGKVIYKSQILTLAYRAVNSDIGFIVCIALPLFYIVGTEVIFTLQEKEENKREKRRKDKEEKIGTKEDPKDKKTIENPKEENNEDKIEEEKVLENVVEKSEEVVEVNEDDLEEKTIIKVELEEEKPKVRKTRTTKKTDDEKKKTTKKKTTSKVSSNKTKEVKKTTKKSTTKGAVNKKEKQ